MDLGTLNKQLKQLNIGVAIRQKGQRLYLRATLPAKPGCDRSPHQQEISLGMYANTEGVEYAKQKAFELGAAIASKSFSWDLYLTATALPLVKEWIQKYEHDYFSRRQRNAKTETTWDKDYRLTFAKLPQDQPLSLEVCLRVISKTPPNSRARQRYVMALGSLCKFAGLDPNFHGLSKYSPSELTPRNIPSDNLIVKCRNSIEDPTWQWVFGMISVYGLRPHEVFNIDVEHLLRYNPDLIVLDGKTGSRFVYPFPFDWWENWDLPYVRLPNVKAKRNSDYGNKISKKFRQYKIPFKAYDLRHRWAIRTLELGLDISLAAQQMGHSRQIHDKTYFRWISKEIHQKAFNSLKDG